MATSVGTIYRNRIEIRRYIFLSRRISRIVCVAKILWVFTDPILSRAGSLAKSTTVIIDAIGIFTAALFRLPRIPVVVAAVL